MVGQGKRKKTRTVKRKEKTLAVCCPTAGPCGTACDDVCAFTVGEQPCHISLLELGLDIPIHHYPVLSCRGGVARTGPTCWGPLNADAEPLPHAC